MLLRAFQVWCRGNAFVKEAQFPQVVLIVQCNYSDFVSPFGDIFKRGRKVILYRWEMFKGRLAGFPGA